MKQENINLVGVIIVLLLCGALLTLTLKLEQVQKRTDRMYNALSEQAEINHLQDKYNDILLKKVLRKEYTEEEKKPSYTDDLLRDIKNIKLN